MKRYWIFAIIAFFSFLMIGSGKFTGVFPEGRDERQIERECLSAAVMEMLAEMPPEHREEWVVAAKENPAILLRINTANLGYRSLR